MPRRYTITPAKECPEKVSQTEFTVIQKRGDITMSAVKALQAVKLSKGAYRIKGQERPVTAAALELEDMPNDKLKVMAANLGVRFHKKQMSRKQLIGLVRRKIDESVTIVDDEEVETDGPS